MSRNQISELLARFCRQTEMAQSNSAGHTEITGYFEGDTGFVFSYNSPSKANRGLSVERHDSAAEVATNKKTTPLARRRASCVEIEVREPLFLPEPKMRGDTNNAGSAEDSCEPSYPPVIALESPIHSSDDDVVPLRPAMVKDAKKTDAQRGKVKSPSKKRKLEAHRESLKAQVAKKAKNQHVPVPATENRKTQHSNASEHQDATTSSDLDKSTRFSKARSGRLRGRPRVSYSELIDLTSDNEGGYDEPRAKRQKRQHPQKQKRHQLDSDDDYRVGMREMTDDATESDPGVVTDDTEAEDIDSSAMEKLQAQKPKAFTKVRHHKDSRTGSDDRRGLDLTLPPLSDIPAIFGDITKKALKLGLPDALQHMHGRSLRVATMCSGTESPLLALQLVNKHLTKLQLPSLNVDHKFSAEIEPFKQAYIERNFNPPLLFRDVREFSKGQRPQGTTAYGSRHDVPGDVDLLVAGSSCVDFSMLNNKPNAQGESEDTFMATVAYAQYARPPMIILENVTKEEAWERFTKEFTKIGYGTHVEKVDSKDYYLPHTRQRKYMLCLDKHVYNASTTSYLRKWGDLVHAFERRASSPVTSFLLPADDPRYNRMPLGAALKELPRRDWLACQRRHENERKTKKLGKKHPVTTLLPDHSDRRWLQHRPERDRELLDIVHLRHATDGVDSLYKTRPIDLSQNVDRIDRANWGITGCLTPKGYPFLTDQCRRFTGHETLTLQGIDIDSVTFSTETDADLKDLAGNAMTSTVVGPAILSALIIGYKELKNLPPATNGEHETPSSSFSRLCGDDQLSSEKIRQSGSPSNWSSFLEDAGKSRRCCHCEGRSELSPHPILVCKDCQHTSCRRCAGNPEHAYGSATISRSSRLLPGDFLSRWSETLPAQLHLDKLPDFTLMSDRISTSIRSQFLDIIKHSADEDFVLEGLVRGRNWEVHFRAPKYKLNLVLGAQPVWQLFANADPTLPANAELRSVLQLPIARSLVIDISKLFDPDGRWEWRIPHRQTTTVRIVKGTSHVPSWRARIGLVDFQNEKYAKELDIECDGDANVFQGISGHYELLQQCGTACESLYRGSQQEPLFFFFDPTATGSVSKDSFVFAKDPERLSLGDCRTTLARLTPDWRPWAPEKIAESTVVSEGYWASCDSTTLNTVEKPVLCSGPDARNFNELADVHSCHDSTAVLTATAIVAKDIASKWTNEGEIRLSDRSFFRDFAWVFAGLPGLQSLRQWRRLDQVLSIPTSRQCSLCSPAPPSMRWIMNGDKVVMSEDHLEAAQYERSVKNRPQGFIIQAIKLSGNQVHVQVGVSLLSLAHRVMSRREAIERIEWRLSSYFERAACQLPPFRLSNNKNDREHPQLGRFKHGLRPDQLRSLSWMKQQERGIVFQHEEIEEALLPALNWRAEVKATADAIVRGGVLADEPSYGKTITSLALINEDFAKRAADDIVSAFKFPDTGLINSAATLIVTPAHLTNQWYEELAEFCGAFEATEALLVKSTAKLRELTVRQLCQAKVVIVPWSLFIHESYAAQLALYAAYPPPSNLKGREFRVWQEQVFQQLPKHVELLQKDGVETYKATMADKLANRLEDPEFLGRVPSQRLKGAKYTAAAKGKAKSTSKKAPHPSGSISAEDHDEWRSLQFPVLHLFRWNRLIVDEFSYLLNKEGGGCMSFREYSPGFASVVGLQAEKRWVLSGTPPLRDFFDVKRIALFLNLDLGADCFAPDALSTDNFKNLSDQLTASEKFRAYQENRSCDWHERRHKQAQAFLDQFARHNAADVNGIECFHTLHIKRLNYDHAVLHEELYSYLSINGMATSGTKLRDDESSRINSLLESGSAESALLRSGSLVNQKSPERRVNKRKQDLTELRSELVEHVNLLKRLKHKAKSEDEIAKYQQFRGQSSGDPEVDNALQAMFSSDQSGYLSSAITLRKQLDETQACVAAYTSGLRALRRYKNLVAIQLKSKTCDAPRCAGSKASKHHLRMLVACGHVACKECLAKRTHLERCPVPGCAADVLEQHIRSPKYFPNHQTESKWNYGAKLKAVVALLRSMPESDQALLFVQNEDFIGEVRECLENSSISCVALEGANSNQIFQQGTGDDFTKVLILPLASEKSSGLNSTCANHVIFLSPLLSSNQYQYDATMMQAIRRVRRTGQKKQVFVHRFAARNTIDVDILERRERLLTEPIWDESHPTRKSLPEPSQEAKGTPEPSRLVRDEEGHFALIPLSQLDDRFEDEDFSSQFPFQDEIDDDERENGAQS